MSKMLHFALNALWTLASSGLFFFLEESGFCCQVLEHVLKFRHIRVVTWAFPSAVFSPDQFKRIDAKLIAT